MIKNAIKSMPKIITEVTMSDVLIKKKNEVYLKLDFPPHVQ